MIARLLSIAACFLFVVAGAQDRRDLPPVTTTFKGSLNLPAPLGNPLFQGYTETIGQLDGVVQFPLYKGLGVGLGGKMTWFALKERVLPQINSGDIRRSTFYGKIAFERYTGDRTFYELSGRAGISNFVFDCATCPDQVQQVFNWGIAGSYYVHVSYNLAFGLTLGFERDEKRFGAADLGLESFQGRREVAEQRNFQNMIIGMSFSTRFIRNPEGPNW